MSSQDYDFCEYCDKPYTIHDFKWCKPCQIIEWIPYDRFIIIKEIDNDESATIYSAIWMDGHLKYNYDKMEKERVSYEKVSLKCLYNSQNITNELLNEVKSYSINQFEINISQIYGISQNPETRDYIIVFRESYCESCGKLIYADLWWCKPCQINNLKQNFTNWTSGDENIDEFIQEKQMIIGSFSDIIVEWIPYSQFNDIKEIRKDDSATLYFAIWIDGPLKYDMNNKEYKRESNKKVTLKILNNSQNIFKDFSNEAKPYSINDRKYDILNTTYGITQNLDTKDYIVVLNDRYCEKCGAIYTDLWGWCKPCQINNMQKNFKYWTSGNEKIDELIQEMQLKMSKPHDMIVEWIPYNQFSNIKVIDKDDFTTLYSAIWIDGPLVYKYNKNEYIKESNRNIVLKCLSYNSQNITNEFSNEAKLYFNGANNTNYLPYGVSQDPDTKDYIIVCQDVYCEICGKIYTNTGNKWCKLCQINNLEKKFANWTSGNDKIDNIIQKMQLNINDCNNVIVEWIPYNQFNYIKEIGNGGFAKVYLATWKDGPLKYDSVNKEYNRCSNSKVALKNLYNSQNITDEFLNEIKQYSISYFDYILKIYGISQNPNTKDYIMVLEYANGGNFNDYINNCTVKWSWSVRLHLLANVIEGLGEIHKNNMVHRDLHTGNILSSIIDTRIRDGVLPTTRKQPFSNCAHDNILALDICNGIRPEINDQEAPKCYIDLMKRCWDPSPDNRPSAIEVEELIYLFSSSFGPYNVCKDEEIKKQFEEAEEYRKANSLSTKNDQSTTHPQACYTSRLLNPFTKDLTECLDCVIND
ncbi:kinase-like domain-containing protein [Rhizophagus clarus]|uniref:Kinase-like domain-containing protein n=1 Tax=Rhizophagus clarus TaxID=94130 RepID=A0A8H3LM54_9GLOM|nr:kinase-like domain-containing protein [Rhizophagus clarus]